MLSKILFIIATADNKKCCSCRIARKSKLSALKYSFILHCNNYVYNFMLVNKIDIISKYLLNSFKIVVI